MVTVPWEHYQAVGTFKKYMHCGNKLWECAMGTCRGNAPWELEQPNTINIIRCHKYVRSLFVTMKISGMTMNMICIIGPVQHNDRKKLIMLV